MKLTLKNHVDEFFEFYFYFFVVLIMRRDSKYIFLLYNINLLAEYLY